MRHNSISENIIIIVFRPSKEKPDLCMQWYGYQYEYITVYYDVLIIFVNYTNGTLRLLNTLLQLKMVLEPELYMCGDVGTSEIYYVATHAFLSLTCIKTPG